MNDIPLAIILPNTVERPLTDIPFRIPFNGIPFNGVPLAIILPNTVQRCTVQQCTVDDGEIIPVKMFQQCTVDDGEIIPVKMLCEDGCNREIYTDQPVNKTSKLNTTAKTMCE